MYLYQIDTTDHTFYVTADTTEEAQEKAGEILLTDFDAFGVRNVGPTPWLEEVL